MNAGLGNLGVSAVQFVVPLVITASVFGSLGGDSQSATKAGRDHHAMWLQNAGFIWVPFIVVSSLLAWFGMNDLASAKASFADQAVIFKRKHNWLMCWLYTGTFGSFIGYSAGFPLLIKTQFPDVNPLAIRLPRPAGGRTGPRGRRHHLGQTRRRPRHGLDLRRHDCRRLRRDLLPAAWRDRRRRQLQRLLLDVHAAVCRHRRRQCLDFPHDPGDLPDRTPARGSRPAGRRAAASHCRRQQGGRGSAGLHLGGGGLRRLLYSEKLRHLDRHDPALHLLPDRRPLRPTASATATTCMRVAERRAEARQRKPLSLYVHIPFCESLCYYCACNKIITKNRAKAATYLGYLKREIACRPRCSPGDSGSSSCTSAAARRPTCRRPDGRADGHLRRCFRLRRQAANIRSRSTRAPWTPERVHAAPPGLQPHQPGRAGLRSRGAEGRQPHPARSEHARAIVEARDAGFRSVSIDLIYGLPKQSPPPWRDAGQGDRRLRPDRIAVYNYAHMPQLFKPQRRIRRRRPAGRRATKLAHAGLCIERLRGAGYVYIGMDHFAKPDDELAVAQRQGRCTATSRAIRRTPIAT
jgi:hypothetical protein